MECSVWRRRARRPLVKREVRFTPSNALQVLQQGDMDTLAAASHWAGCQLPKGAALLWSGDDQKGAFYAWELPLKWRALMTFRWPIHGKYIGLDDQPEVWLAARVIPMGWVQCRRLALQPEPLGAGLPGSSEVRRDRAMPVSATKEPGGWIQYYLDDYDCPEIVPASMWKELQGTLSDHHRQQREAYHRAGVRIVENKAHLRQPKVERMGAAIDGVSGWLSVSTAKKLDFVLWAMKRQVLSQKPLLMILGRLVRCFEFRRPLMSLLNYSWPRLPRKVARPLSLKCWLELICSICILPMAATNLFTPVSGLVTCSDASENGGGLCASAGTDNELWFRGVGESGRRS